MRSSALLAIALVFLAVGFCRADETVLAEFFAEDKIMRMALEKDDDSQHIFIAFNEERKPSVDFYNELKMVNNWIIKDNSGRLIGVDKVTIVGFDSPPVIMSIKLHMISNADNTVTLDFKYEIGDKIENHLVGRFELPSKGLDRGERAFVINDTSKVYVRGSSPRFEVERLTEQESLLAFKYDIHATLLGFNNLRLDEVGYFPSFLNWRYELFVESAGVIGNDDQVQNGTTTTSGLRLRQLWWHGFRGRLNSIEIRAGYNLETASELSGDEAGTLIDLKNESFTASIMTEIPYTNFLALFPRDFIRDVSALRVKYQFWHEGVSKIAATKTARHEVMAYWELPFSKYFIVEGRMINNTLQSSVMLLADESSGRVQDEQFKSGKYYSIRIAQTMDAFTNAFAFLIPYLEQSGKDVKSNNFIFFEYTDGRMPPLFEDKIEHKIGVSLYF